MPKTMHPIVLSAIGLSMAAAANAQVAARSVTLKVGDKAPAIAVKEWVKGSPVTKLGEGKVNIVEFWATWCGPCKVSIPHLTELAHKYKGKATFIGVSVFEDPQAKDESFLKGVDSFVKTMGEKMDYTVAADGLSATMGKTWMEAAGQGGIPTAFVVDQKGQIAWIGHPMMGLDEVVGKVIDGTFDVKAAAAQKEKAESQAKRLQEDAKPFIDAMSAKKMDVAVSELDRLIAKYPDMVDRLSVTKFNILLQSNEPAAYKYAKELAVGAFKNNSEMLNQLAWSIVDDKAKLKHPDYATALVIAKRAAEVTKMNDPMILDTYAYAQFKCGNKAEALSIEEKAVDLAKKANLPVETQKEISDRLSTMKSSPAK